MLHYQLLFAIICREKEHTLNQGGRVHDNAAYSLLLQGKVLYLNALLATKKFRDRGNKDGAVGFHVLQATGLGLAIVRKPQRGTNMVNKTIYNA